MSKKRSSKMSRRYAAKIFGRYELDEEGKPMKDKFGDKIEVSFYKFYRGSLSPFPETSLGREVLRHA